MTAGKRTPRRPAGTGSLFVRMDAAGRESCYGKFRLGGRQVKRRLGPCRLSGTTIGLTRTQAEGELRKLLAEAATLPALRESPTLAEAAHAVSQLELDRLPRTNEQFPTITRKSTSSPIASSGRQAAWQNHR